ncbi:DMT family transporter [Solitalea koreensis]|uniref:Threonine/homoserine efflux transporter RhtA n=1 Tax=Solitalea koreensis TaxID=543615 RepID=A0A521AY10_9SPHI|nr:DMT family transporter [Solitalea koreensis]SMO39752.1 Threonine/homoserine efflux transporter RhtA [Solitalea koreensis]
MSRQVQVHIALFLVTLIYGATFTIAKEVMPKYIPPYGFIVMRVWGATILFMVAGFFSSVSSIPVEKKDVRLIVLSAITGVGANMLFFFKGLSLTTPIKAAIEMVSTPLFVAILAFVVLKEKVTLMKILGLTLGLTGAVLLILWPHFSFTGGTVLGDFYVFLNAIIYAYYLIIAKPLILKYQAINLIKWTFLIGSIFVFPFGFKDLTKVNWASIPLHIWFAIAFIIVCTTFLTYLLNGWALKYVHSSVVGAYIYLQPVLASIIAVLLGKDVLTLHKAIFSVFIFAGVYLVSRKQQELSQ